MPIHETPNDMTTTDPLNQPEEGSSINEAGASFWIQDGRHLAVAEISAVPRELATEYLGMTPFDAQQKDAIAKLINDSAQVYFFNRLNVPEPLQKKGHGRQLLAQVMAHMDQEESFLINTASAYGSRSQEDLIAYYQDSGMTLLAPEGLLGYHPKLSALGLSMNARKQNKVSRVK